MAALLAAVGSNGHLDSAKEGRVTWGHRRSASAAAWASRAKPVLHDWHGQSP